MNTKGFTLIELLIVVAIIGILAAIAIPGYIGMQEKSRKGAIIRSATSVVPELQAWLLASKAVGNQTEVDTDFNGSVVSGVDSTNSGLAAAGVDSTYVNSRNSALTEKSPWSSGLNLWSVIADDSGGTNAGAAGRIVISSTTQGIRIIARDNTGAELVNKFLTVE